MEIIKFNELKFKRPFLKDVMQMALENDLDVYVYVSKNGWKDDGIISSFLYNKDDLWAYCQLDYFFGVDLATHYRPCTDRGSGRQIYHQKTIVNLKDLMYVLDACNYDYYTYKCKPYNIKDDTILKYYKVEL